MTEEVRSLFLTGLKLLHAFEYPEARAAFQQARQSHESGEFIMGLWGELMCNYQIIWDTREFQTAEDLITTLTQARNSYSGNLNPSETVLLDGALKLFGNDNASRSKQPYENGSNVQLFHQYLDNQLSLNDHLESEIKIFNQLAKLATRQSILDYTLERSVIENLNDLLTLPDLADHPGLHHYLVHASESPRLAKEPQSHAYDAAQWLQQLSNGDKNTSSIHLTHMPTHFYFAVGDWTNVYTINQSAWNKSIQRASDLSLGDSSLAFHEHLWRVFALLQAGNYADAWNDSQSLYQKIEHLRHDGASDETTRVMRTYFAFEQAYLKLELPANSQYRSELNAQILSDHLMSPWGKTAYHFMKAWDALEEGNDQQFNQAKISLTALQRDRNIQLTPMEQGAIPVMVKQLEAQQQRKQGNIDEAIKLASSAEQSYRTMRWDHGVPLVVKPLLEYIGELYMEKAGTAATYAPIIHNVRSVKSPTDPAVIISHTGMVNQAMGYFQAELDDFFPRRRKSLEGLLSAAQQAGDQTTQNSTAAIIATLDQPLDYQQAVSTDVTTPGSASSNAANLAVIVTLAILTAVKLH
ncbi:hypothetical protein EOPP23_19110 [Endozoicomonas sp. OPT23]|nr:hypothetical protein [Endozoicomonas sp. OPT23]